jgi:hypothetical protein
LAGIVAQLLTDKQTLIGRFSRRNTRAIAACLSLTKGGAPAVAAAAPSTAQTPYLDEACDLDPDPDLP